MELNANEWNILADKIKEIIAWGIDANKMSVEEYLAGKGKEYRNMPALRAYGREGLPCPRCGASLVRLVIGGRSSCYCPVCQKEAVIK